MDARIALARLKKLQNVTAAESMCPPMNLKKMKALANAYVGCAHMMKKIRRTIDKRKGNGYD